MPVRRFVRTSRDEVILRRLTEPSTVDAVANLFSKPSAMYRRIAKLVRAGLLQRLAGQTVPGLTKPKEKYCVTPSVAPNP